METFLARYRNITVLAVAIFAQILLLGYQIRNDRDVRLIRLWGVTAITPVARAVHGGHGLLSGLWNNYIWLRGARQQNEAIRAELDRLKLENQSLRNALGAAERLKLLAAYQQNIPSQTLVASVIGMGANPNSRVVFLDRGSGAGVRPGMAVITPDGIVGKVQAVFPGSSLVLLISDANAAVGVILDKSRAHGIMKGTGLYEARITYVPHEEKVSPGEKVFTSGEDRIYPKGLLVGTVSRVQEGRDFQEISLQPGARLNHLEEVLVVTQGVHQGIPSTLPRAQAPPALLPPPPPEVKDDFLDPVRQAPAGPSSNPPSAAPARNPLAGESYTPRTDADRVKSRYREIGTMQGHTFGEGLPGSKPPDFNLGRTPPGRAAGSPAAPLQNPNRPAGAQEQAEGSAQKTPPSAPPAGAKPPTQP